jgi:hypothetical protein
MQTQPDCKEGTEVNKNPKRGKGIPRCVPVCEDYQHRDETTFKYVPPKRRTQKSKPKSDLVKQTDNTSTNGIVKELVISSPNSSYNPCDEINRIDEEMKRLINLRKKFTNDCNSMKYLSSEKQPKTHLELLKHIFLDESLNCDILFSRFPDSKERSGNLYTKPYVFESLWKIIFLLGLDDKLAVGMDREFKKSLEANTKKLTVYEYLSHESDGRINSGNAFGVCDLMFITKEPKKTDTSKTVVTKQKNEIKDDICGTINEPIGNAFLFTSKFYSKEKGIGNYDIANIHLETTQKYIPLHLKKQGDTRPTYEIVALINNKSSFLEKLGRRTDKQSHNFINPDRVFGYDELRDIYYIKLKRWLNKTFDKPDAEDNTRWNGKWKQITGEYLKTVNIVDILRIHQEYFVKTTQGILGDKTHGKIIWGAVARSGKSYMVGGLIAIRKPKIVILILGAVGETKEQFIDIFKNYADLKEYIVWDTQDKPKQKPEFTKHRDKLVIIISQEKLRGDISNTENNYLINELQEYIKEEQKIVFFDEIHQGGGETSEQHKTIDFFYDKTKTPELKEPILIMVTATYTKPMLKYSNGYGEDKTLHLITWSYTMIMKMKQFNISMTELGSKDDDTKLIPYPYDGKEDEYNRRMKILNEIIIKHNENGKTDDHISSEYGIYPDLVYLIPSLKPNIAKEPEIELDNQVGKFRISDSSNVKRLWETMDGKVKYPNAIRKYIEYIYTDVYGDLLNKQYNMVANGDGNRHTQLWFLPTHLRSDKKVNRQGEPIDGSEFDIISRGLATEIIHNKLFENFNVCIIHSLDNKGPDIIKDENGSDRVFLKCIRHKSVKQCIREVERADDKKSLIILTGKRLRLGVSLPCVDIAIHMDPIESYDIMYQSMFRVLTERTGKRKGFFVDMIADRSVKFIYNYTIQEKAQHNQKRITKDDIRNSLLLFDVNGLSTQLSFSESLVIPESYDMISQRFGIKEGDDDKQFLQNISDASIDTSEVNNDVSDLLKVMLQQPNIKDEIIKFTSGFTRKMKYKQDKQAVTVVGNKTEFEQQGNLPQQVPHNVPVVPIENDATVIDNAIKSVKNTLTLYALFSSDDTTTIDKMLNDDVLNYDAIRECKDDKIIHMCYLGTTGIDSKVSHINGIIKTLEKQLEDTKNNPNPIEAIKIRSLILEHENERRRYIGWEDEQLEEQISEQLKLIRLIYTYNGEHSKLTLNNLYRYINNDMKQLKNKLKTEQESFSDTSSGFCPASFNDVKNEKVLEIVRKYLTPKDTERKLFGEVFTPLELVCEMLSHLPADVWTNKNLKWFDPANGIGNFPIVVYYKLMETLKSVPLKDRSKHIIENMLYMNELGKINVGLCKMIFKTIDPQAKPNIRTSNFLSEFMVSGKSKDKFFFDDIKEFDIIIGNPPYNPPKTETGSSGNSIWQQFVIKSFYLLSDKGYLDFIHPPGWRKPTDETFDAEKLELEDGDYTKETDDKNKRTVKQIRQGMVWPFLKDKGAFLFIYTNDQRSKKTEYINHFPAVDYYVYQKGGDMRTCDTKNVFFGEVKLSENVKIDYNLKYLPSLITKETLDILHKVTNKEGDKTSFKRGIDERGIEWIGKTIDWIYDSNSYGFQYKKHGIEAVSTKGSMKEDTVNVNKVVLNFGGGINSYNVKHIPIDDEIGVLDKTMYSKVASDKEGKYIERLFSSDLVRFIFLITQYASGQITQNEPLVANSITIPPVSITDYYKFFDIEQHKQYIEDTLKQYDETKTKQPMDAKKQTRKKRNKGGGKQTRRKRWFFM